MGHGHGHGHAAGRAADRRRLRRVLAVTVTVMAVEVVGALVTGSLALLADAGHMASDSLSIAKGSQNTVATHAYINHALGAQQQATQTELTSYSPANTESQPEISEAAQEFDVSRPEVVDATIPQNAEYWGEHFPELSETWYAWVSQ